MLESAQAQSAKNQLENRLLFKEVAVAVGRPLVGIDLKMALNVLDPNSRFEKSLGLLTTRFVNLLQEAEDGILDLKVVSLILTVFITFYSKSDVSV